ncbi:hypothetical protein [Singulisphaera acidiphila]|uniref:SGNH hydrolase-type esterase domain-containing protein n=1 Tax=Singulisphaera acidiphila (strain ATCC BAA-1392 / DSM 18658 / VKM B-2454 / MOB10) TaxID=886293 RepID=L0DRG4_SINAD|nr:hypothetical protein [Singulisphaera acidiphila]AGA31567.1 hypothetical protein Sinac_7534 [Singulisphaera acidiphila DSM 18658]
MNHKRIAAAVGWLSLILGTMTEAQTSPATDPVRPAADPKEQPIDFERARTLLDKRQRGEMLTEDETAYLKRAIAARQGQQQGPRPVPRESIGVKPLSEMTAEDRYKQQEGGLYGGGRNTPPDSHRREAEQELARIQPLDADGQPAADGKIVFVSISMSNATQEFARFKRIADAAPAKSAKLTIVDCAQGGQAMAEWAPPDARPWTIAEQLLTRAKVAPKQVQIAWIKLANKGPHGDLEEHGRKLQRDTLAVIQNAKSRFPNLRIVYLSSRIYGGYATTHLNPEPFAFESAFPARWLIQDQIKGSDALNFKAERGPIKAPLLLWGPYLWADGTTPRASDKLVYNRADLADDGTHPSEAGRDKVAKLMLDFFKLDPLAKPWFAP